MLKKMKKRVLKIMYIYHGKMADYCWEKIEKHENSTYWITRYVKHTRHLLTIAGEALTMEGI